MLRLSRTLRLSLTLMLAAASAWGAPESESENLVTHQTEKVSVKAWVELGEFSGDEQLRRLYVSTGTNRFGFMVSSGLRVDTTSTEKVTLTESHYQYFLALQIVTAPSGFRARVENQFPGGVISEEPGVTALNRQCTIFKVQWKSADGPYRLGMVAFVATPAGVLEISLVSNPDHFTEGQRILGDLLNRARSNETGRLQMEIYRPLGYN